MRDVYRYPGSCSECLVEAIPPKNAFRLIRVSRGNKHGSRQSELFEDGPGDFGEVRISVVKGNQHSALRKRRPFFNRLQHLWHGNNLVVACQMPHLPRYYQVVSMPEALKPVDRKTTPLNSTHHITPSPSF